MHSDYFELFNLYFGIGLIGINCTFQSNDWMHEFEMNEFENQETPADLVTLCYEGGGDTLVAFFYFDNICFQNYLCLLVFL